MLPEDFASKMDRYCFLKRLFQVCVCVCVCVSLFNIIKSRLEIYSLFTKKKKKNSSFFFLPKW